MEKKDQSLLSDDKSSQEIGSVSSSQEIPKSIRRKIEDSPDINFCKNQGSPESSKNPAYTMKPDISASRDHYMRFSPEKLQGKKLFGNEEQESEFIK